jgi:hypothetical protein
MRAFNVALDRAKGWYVGFVDAGLGHQLIQESHQRRDADGGEYTPQELADATHPYRRLFLEHSEHLQVVAVADASNRLATFGESKRTSR